MAILFHPFTCLHLVASRVNHKSHLPFTLLSGPLKHFPLVSFLLYCSNLSNAQCFREPPLIRPISGWLPVRMMHVKRNSSHKYTQSSSIESRVVFLHANNTTLWHLRSPFRQHRSNEKHCQNRKLWPTITSVIIAHSKIDEFFVREIDEIFRMSYLGGSGDQPVGK